MIDYQPNGSIYVLAQKQSAEIRYVEKGHIESFRMFLEDDIDKVVIADICFRDGHILVYIDINDLEDWPDSISLPES